MLRFVTVLMMLALPSASLAQDFVRAKPKYTIAPAYPAACAPETAVDIEPVRVTVRYGVTRRGQTVDVEVVESTNDCFNAVSVATVRGWTFEPGRFDGRAVAQPENEIVFSFVWQDITKLSVVDAQPVKRVPPSYPRKCMTRASSREMVVVIFDVTETGTTDNIRVGRSTLECLNEASVEAVSLWLYNPKLVDGAPARRIDVETIITYNLSGGAPSKEEFVRRAVRSRLEAVERALQTDARKALDILAEVETKYAETFSRAELGLFHQMRAAARINIGDYRGALDDLRITQHNSFYEEQFQAVYDTIAELQAAIAAQEAAAQDAASVDK